MRTLLFDLGNTRLKWRYIDGENSKVSSGGVLNSTILNTSFQPDNQWRNADWVFASTVSGDAIRNELSRTLGELGVVIDYWAKSVKCGGGVTNAYQNFCSLGVDRWLAMIAGRRLTKFPFCVIDCGSAITVDFVGEQGVHEGGLILPGMRLLFESLNNSTANLVGNYHLDRNLSPGTSTSDCINRGITLLLSSVSVKVSAWKSRQVSPQVKVFITGGDAELFAQLLEVDHEIKAELVLDGLLIQAKSELGIL